MTAGSKIDVYCVSCGEDQEADAQTGRCLKCGRQAVQTTTQAQVDRNNHLTHSSPSQAYRGPHTSSPPPPVTPAAAPTVGDETNLASTVLTVEARFTLPSSKASQRWIDQSKALRAGFLTAAAEADKKADAASVQASAHRAEAMRLRNSARVFDQLLEQVAVDDGAPSERPKVRRAQLDGRPWARTHTGESFAACTKCGRADRKHKAKGLCSGCYKS